MSAANPEFGSSDKLRLPRTCRIHRSEEIRALMRRGKRKRTSHLDVFFEASPVSRFRLGIVVPKHRRRIVDRNLLKRRIREIGRVHVLPRLRRAGIAMDVLIRARPEAYRATFDELLLELQEVTEGICSSASY